MEFRRKPSRALWVGALIISLAVIVGVVLWSRNRPVALEVSPAAEARMVNVQTPLEISFSRPMRRNSVIENLSITPASEGDTTWEGNTLVYTPAEPWPNGAAITVTLETGARAASGQALAEPVSWTFHTARVMLGYLWPSDGDAELYALDITTGESIQLTESDGVVLDFSTSPDETRVYYTVDNAEGTTTLMQLDRVTGEHQSLTTCSEALCQRPQPAPDSTTLVFENTTTAQILQIPIPPPPGGSAIPIRLGGTQHPSWSVNGWLAAYDQRQEAYLFQDIEGGTSITFSNQTGEPGSWAPDGSAYVAAEIIAEQASQLIRYNLDAGTPTTTILTPQVDQEFASPAYSPDGSWLVYAHRYLDLTRWTRGRQIWIMDADGGEPSQLTDEPIFNHSAFAWHPDSSRLAYLRFNQATLSEPPEIWVLDLRDGTQLRLVIGGVNPHWLP